MSENTCEIRVGRLMEVRVVTGLASIAEVESLYAKMVDALSRNEERGPAIAIVDWRDARVLRDEVEAEAPSILGDFCDCVLRFAVLGSQERPVELMQLFRIVCSAEHPQANLYVEPGPLIDWVDRVLTAEESLRAREFLGACGTLANAA